MFNWLFIRKADYQKIKRILQKENFIFKDEDIANLLKGNQKGTRYGNIVLMRKEAGGQEKRFLKIVLDGTWRTYKLFRRQVEVTRALAEDSQYNFPKLSVKSFSLKPPIPYAVFETREEGENFGFMHDRPEYYEKFNETDVLNLAKVIYGFHLSGHHMDPGIFKYTKNISSKKHYYKKELEKLLNKKITHRKSDGAMSNQSVEKHLMHYIQIPDLRNRLFEILEKTWDFVGSSKVKEKKYLVHADMALDNVYKHEDGQLEPLDFEWVGDTDNPVVPIMYDYGNLRARAWSSPEFQSRLDKAMLEEGKKQYGDENMIKAALALGVLRSGLGMCRYHLDYKHTTRNDKRTEEDYFAMFPRTVSSITELLTKS